MKIVSDSLLDLTSELKERLQITQVPLSISLMGKTYVDDESLDVSKLMEDIAACEEKIVSAAPAPRLFQDAFQGSDDVFAITVSSRLSATHQNAVIAKNDLESQGNAPFIHVFDSKSASAGEVLVGLKLRDFIDVEMSKEDIVRKTEEFIGKIKTYFALDDISTLVKNGRIKATKALLINVLGIKPILGDNGNGEIESKATARGEKQIVKKMADFVEKSGKATADENLVICHCQNRTLAEKVRDEMHQRFDFKEILVVPTGGCSSVYANVGGIILAF